MGNFFFRRLPIFFNRLVRSWVVTLIIFSLRGFMKFEQISFNDLDFEVYFMMRSDKFTYAFGKHCDC